MITVITETISQRIFIEYRLDYLVDVVYSNLSTNQLAELHERLWFYHCLMWVELNSTTGDAVQVWTWFCCRFQKSTVWHGLEVADYLTHVADVKNRAVERLIFLIALIARLAVRDSSTSLYKMRPLSNLPSDNDANWQINRYLLLLINWILFDRQITAIQLHIRTSVS